VSRRSQPKADHMIRRKAVVVGADLVDYFRNIGRILTPISSKSREGLRPRKHVRTLDEIADRINASIQLTTE
jgi:hypothetical protein